MILLHILLVKTACNAAVHHNCLYKTPYYKIIKSLFYIHYFYIHHSIIVIFRKQCYSTYVPNFFEVILVYSEQLASSFRAHCHVSGQVVHYWFAKSCSDVQSDNSLQTKRKKKIQTWKRIVKYYYQVLCCLTRKKTIRRLFSYEIDF